MVLIHSPERLISSKDDSYFFSQNLPSSDTERTFCSESVSYTMKLVVYFPIFSPRPESFLQGAGSNDSVWVLQTLNMLFCSDCEGKVALRTTSDDLAFLHVPSKCLLIWNDQGHERLICCSLFRCTGFASLSLP